jgi:hypothetical protein
MKTETRAKDASLHALLRGMQRAPYRRRVMARPDMAVGQPASLVAALKARPWLAGQCVAHVIVSGKKPRK